MSAAPAKTIEKRPLTDLKQHPRQAASFRAPLQHEVEELADDLKRNGLLTAVECLPDGTILCGHKRVAAATLLGWQTITCTVRHDLAALGAGAAERRLIEDNLNRRQLAPLELARCYKRLKVLGGGGLCQQDRADLRDRIGKTLKMSGRNLDRYLRVLDRTPQEVQDAVSSGSLAVTLAEKVAGLDRATQQKVAAEIRTGADPAEVVRRHVKPAPTKHKKADDALGAFLRSLRCGIDDLGGRADEARAWLSDEEARLLEEAEATIRAIRDRAAAEAAGQEADTRRAVEEALADLL